MSKHEAIATEEYLEAAARGLAQSSPAVSAHLMLSKSSREMKSRSLFHEGSCQRCGTLQIPGKTSQASIERVARPETKNEMRINPRAKTKDRRKPGVKWRKWLRMECTACHTVEKTALDALKPQKRRQPPAKTPVPQNAEATKVSETMAAAPPPSANRSSKARAKARRGGLSAMTMRPREPHVAKAGLGLDLMDLMKEGDR